MAVSLAPEERAALEAVADRIIPEDGNGPGAALGALERDAPAAFALLRTLVLEGAFGDPAHGGNADGAGWWLLGYPGPRHVLTLEDQEIVAL